MFNHSKKNTMHLTTVVALTGVTIIGMSGIFVNGHANNVYKTSATTVSKHSSQMSDDQRLTPHTIDRMKYIAPVKPATEEKPAAAESQAPAQSQPAAVQTPAAAQPQQSQAASSTTSATPSQPAPSAPASAPSAPAQPAPAPAPQQRTDGFNLNGSHFNLANYADTSGAEVPQWTPNVYRYVVLPNYYLAEGQSAAGAVARAAGIGSTLILNGQTLHMTGIISVNRKDPNAFESMRQVGSQNKAVLQTCYDATGNNLKVALFN